MQGTNIVVNMPRFSSA